jgi:immunoglobulin-binding protein 1
VDVQSDFDLISSLLAAPDSAESDDEDSDVEDAVRDATVLLMRLFYAQTYAQLDHLSDELQLLKSAPPPEPELPEGEKRRTTETDWKLDTPRPGFGRGGPLLDPQGRVRAISALIQSRL